MMIMSEELKSGVKLKCLIDDKPFEKGEIYEIKSFDGTFLNFIGCDIQLRYFSQALWRTDKAPGMYDRVDFKLQTIFDDIACGMGFRCIEDYGTFEKGVIYYVQEHNEYNLLFVDSLYRVNSKELTTYFEYADVRPCSERLATDILDLFEKLLDKYDITIPDEDREGDEEEARLYGMNYSRLQEDISSMLSHYVD